MSIKTRPRYYAIGYVAKETNLPAHTLRYWEKEFKQLAPRKSRTGRRMYTEEDLALIRQIQHLLHERGFTIKGAREVLEKGDIGRPAPILPTPEPPKTPTPPPAAPGKSEREKQLERKLSAMKRHIRELIAIIDGGR